MWCKRFKYLGSTHLEQLGTLIEFIYADRNLIWYKRTRGYLDAAQ